MAQNQLVKMPDPIDFHEARIRLAEQMDDAVAATNQIYRNPDVLAHSANDAAHQHDSATIEVVRAGIEKLIVEGEILIGQAQSALENDLKPGIEELLQEIRLLAVKGEEFIAAQKAKNAKVTEVLRAHTAKMAALRKCVTEATDLLKLEFKPD